jgi:5'-3' exonuclease
MENKNNKKERPIIFIDGFNIFLRHFMVNETMNTNGEPVGGVIGFLKFLNATIVRFAPAKVYVVWESGGGSPRRKALYKEYKANRAKVKDFQQNQKGEGNIKGLLKFDENAKVTQLTLLNQILKNTPVCQVFVKETECDDIIGYFAKEKFSHITHPGTKKIIVSSDKDFYQLLDDPNTSIYDPAKKVLVTEKDVLEIFQIAPRNFCLAKAFVGDNSDNIEGVPNVGFKTLRKRFEAIGDPNTDVTITDILEGCKSFIANNKKIPKLYENILQCEDVVRRNWKLMYLNSSTMSASQLQKIDYIVENHVPICNKLGMLQILMKNGINNNFNLDIFVSNLQMFLLF